MKKFEELLKEDPNSKDEILKDVHAKLDALKKAKDEYIEKKEKEIHSQIKELQKQLEQLRNKKINMDE
jgi:chaperonin cofactor prefoldin